MSHDHAFLMFKNKGMSGCLRGKIAIELVFVEDERTVWMPDEMERFYAVYQKAIDCIKKQAVAAAVPLSFATVVGRYHHKGYLKTDAFGADIMNDVHSEYIRSHGCTSHEAYVASRKSLCQADELALIYVMERSFRAFAYTGGRLEYCALTETDNEHAILHELLHLFGAFDLYYPYHIYGLTMEYFPKTAMCTYEGMEIDPLTQYLVGWKATIPPEAKEFMEKLRDYTEARHDQACRLEVYRNYEELLLQQGKPYTTVTALQKSCKLCDPWAEYLLGVCYRDGIGLPQDVQKAEVYFERSGKTGLTIAAAAHAQMILCRGPRSAQDRENLWLLFNYNSNNHMSLNSLYIALLLGGKEQRDKAVRMALSQYEQRQFYQDCGKRSAWFYRNAERLSAAIPALQRAVSYERARYDKMITQGDPDLYFVIAKLMEEGEFVRKNPAGAVDLYRRAAEGGNYRACEALSRCFRDGFGTQRDPQAARQWSARSAACRAENPWDAFCRII